MIRINLAKGTKATTHIDSDSVQAAESLSASALQRSGLMRVMALFIIPAALYIYEIQTLPTYQADIAQKTKLLQELKEKSAKGKAAVEEMNKFQEQKSQLQSQLNSIEELKKDRLREVHILDTMQREMPDRVWLNKIDLREGKLNLSGVAGTDPDLTAFMDVLSRSAYFKEVNLVRTNEYVTAAGVFKKFEILCLTER